MMMSRIIMATLAQVEMEVLYIPTMVAKKAATIVTRPTT